MPIWLVPLVAAWLASMAGAAWFAWDYRGARADQAQLAAVQLAIEQTQAAQKEINDVTQKQLDETRGINAGLLSDLERLRRRPSRTSPPRVDCPAATGAELLREDAEFLSREAARADTLRAALSACYEYADAIRRR